MKNQELDEGFHHRGKLVYVKLYQVHTNQVNDQPDGTQS